MNTKKSTFSTFFALLCCLCFCLSSSAQNGNGNGWGNGNGNGNGSSNANSGGIGKETENVATVTEVMINNIMPVPANDFISVSYMIPNNDSATEITIYDLTGKVVMTQQLDAPKGMNMSKLNKEKLTEFGSFLMARDK